jgi:hypothetical protein
MEDTPNCRASNHFHNPLKAWADAGLTDTQWGLQEGVYQHCRDWSNRIDPASGKPKFYGNLTWATGRTAPGDVMIPQAAEGEMPFTWDMARSSYYGWLTGGDATIRRLQGAEALYTLGHVLHLLEDMGVPAHVRNEPPAREEA